MLFAVTIHVVNLGSSCYRGKTHAYTQAIRIDNTG